MPDYCPEPQPSPVSGCEARGPIGFVRHISSTGLVGKWIRRGRWWASGNLRHHLLFDTRLRMRSNVMEIRIHSHIEKCGMCCILFSLSMVPYAMHSGCQCCKWQEDRPVP